jgi:DNA-binding GntR family transcriptional regulator
MSSHTIKPPKGSLADTAYERIRGDIVQCTLEPGSEVTESELAQRYGLGKAPIRAALQRLAQEDLVQPLPRRGHLIAPITLKDVHEMFELRLLLEPPMAAKAASRITDADVERLRQLTQRDVEMGTPFNPANTGFHLLLIDLAGNQRARDTVAGLLYQLERVANLRLTVAAEESLIREHKQIIDAMEGRDPEAAKRAVADHIEGARRTVINAILESETLLSVEIGRR